MQKIAAVKKQLLNQNYQIGGQNQQLRNIKVRLGDPLKINGDLISSHIPDQKMLAQFEQHLADQLGQPVTVDFSVRLVTENYFTK